jgi:hypothetical protein
MSELKVNKISPRSGTDVTLGDSGDTFTLGSGANIAGLTLSDNILFDTASKGIYLGVTSATASNLLDDYEEGTWTPAYIPSGTAFDSISYGTRVGIYVKIGKIVYVEGRMSTSSITKGSASGGISIEGLPFNAEGSESSFNFAYARNFLGEQPISGLTRSAGTDEINIYYRTTAPSLTQPIQVSDMDTGSGDNEVYFSGTYTTTA